MGHTALELHDSTVIALRAEGDDVVLELDAYIHVSDGEPGVDAGTGWSQPVRFTVRAGVVRRDFDGDSLSITDGAVRIGARVLDNMLPLALDEIGAVAVELVGSEGRLTVTGAALRIEPTGAAVFVERVPGDDE
jgi:hypothetical protein